MDAARMGSVQLQNPCHAAGLLHKANQMRLAGTLCDVAILVDGQEFRAHRTVLACTSKMFEILFHRNSQHYTLDFLSPKTFQQILEYAYTATLQARVEDLDDLLYAAEILEIEYLEEQCLKILETIQAADEPDAEAPDADADARRPCGPAGTAHEATSGTQSPAASAAPAPMSPTAAAVDTLMSLGPSLLQGAAQREEALSGASPPGAERPDERAKEGPGTPTRGSVITSARGLHYGRDEGAEAPGEAAAGLPAAAPPALYAVLPKHKSDSALGGPPAGAPALHVPPALAVSVDLGAYGGLLPQAFLPRELFSKLGELAAGMKPEGRAAGDACGACGAELPDSDAVEQHRKLHSAMKTYGCELCGKRFLDSLRLRMHLLAHSAGAKAFVCDQCGAQFSKEDALDAHRQTHTGTDMAVFCLLCGKRFQTQAALQQHMEVHAGVRSYICSECNRTFPSHTALKRHLRSHTGDHPYECEFCGSCFRDESTLKGHKRIHTGEKPYECNGCGKKFSLKHQLETHYRVHTGEKPFECKLCHQRSRDYSAMIKHLRTHNGASPYQCTICLEYCPSLSAMQKHMKGHKPEEIPTDWRIEKTYLYLCYV
ncbi:zinc finger and BTB domain-containing protein 16 [Nothoprocta perdicaria]|uniref:Zinc finger and BTB domain containing 16 n=2 Tax=Tinamidae TaxID=8803 RepID=A0A8C7E9L5_NOTPE|nr:zinc finger and BTB domain-containing protein 16 [Nothoprocta perdicaria]